MPGIYCADHIDCSLYYHATATKMVRKDASTDTTPYCRFLLKVEAVVPARKISSYGVGRQYVFPHNGVRVLEIHVYRGWHFLDRGEKVIKYLDDDIIIARPNLASSGKAASSATEHVERKVPAWSRAATLRVRTATPEAASRATEHVERDVLTSSGAASLPARAARPKAASGATETIPLPMDADTTSGATEHVSHVSLDPDTESEADTTSGATEHVSRSALDPDTESEPEVVDLRPASSAADGESQADVLTTYRPLVSRWLKALPSFINVPSTALTRCWKRR